METISWPSVGVAGGALILLLMFLVWFIRQLASGTILTRKQADTELASAVRRGDEWKETALEERAGRQENAELLKQALNANRIVDQFFTEYLPTPEHRKDEAVTTA